MTQKLPINLLLPDASTAFVYYLAAAHCTQAGTIDDVASACFFSCVVAPAADCLFVVGVDGIAVGQVTFPAGLTVGSFASFSPGAFVFTVGSVIESAAEAVDASIKTISMCFVPNVLT